VLAVVANRVIERVESQTVWTFYEFGPEGARVLIAVPCCSPTSWGQRRARSVRS